MICAAGSKGAGAVGAINQLIQDVVDGQLHLRNERLGLFMVGLSPLVTGFDECLKDYRKETRKGNTQPAVVSPPRPAVTVRPPPTDAWGNAVMVNPPLTDPWGNDVGGGGGGMVVGVGGRGGGVGVIGGGRGAGAGRGAGGGRGGVGGVRAQHQDLQLVAAEQDWPPECAYNTEGESVLKETLDFLVAKNKEKKDKFEELTAMIATLQSPAGAAQNSKLIKKLHSDRGVTLVVDAAYQLGDGTEATVYYGIYTKPGTRSSKHVAVKVSKGANPYNSKEAEILEHITDGSMLGVVRYHTHFTTEYGPEERDVLVLDVGSMTLRDLMTQNTMAPFLDADDKFKLAKSLCQAVKALHSRDDGILVHRDLRSENVLIMQNGVLRLTDFGLARIIKRDGNTARTKIPLTTMQPYEVQVLFRALPDNAKMDVPLEQVGDIFMLGVVLWELYAGTRPFLQESSIWNQEKPTLPNMPGEPRAAWLQHLLSLMLSHDKEKRPSIQMVLLHPFFCNQSYNFGRIFIDSIEQIVCLDHKPKRSEAFTKLLPILQPIELMLQQGKGPLPEGSGGDANDHSDWATPLADAGLFDYDAGRALPLQKIEFFNDTQDPYPLPEVEHFCRWLRNVRQHYKGNDVLKSRMRMAKGPGPEDYYAYPGEFFMSHPSVNWFLPEVWNQTVQQRNALELGKRQLLKQIAALTAVMVVYD
mmetsp:Transcript_23523/g.50848  ORF Transcript_23523/g.50848 Transcript_23523/m.50848 type:complete len:697 (-) Transcript_23523:166-2256(-)